MTNHITPPHPSFDELQQQLDHMLQRIHRIRQEVRRLESPPNQPAFAPEDREKLLHVIHLISANLRLDDLLDTVIDVSLRLTGAERGFLMLIAEDGSFDFKVARRIDQTDLEAEPFQVSRTVLRQVVESQQPVFIRDTGKELEFSRSSSIAQLELLSVIAVPLIGRSSHTLIGAIYVDSQSINQVFEPHDMELVQAVANQAAIAIENARLYEHVEQDRQDLERIYEVSKAINATLNPEELLTLIVDTAIDITAAERGVLMLTHPKVHGTYELEFRIARDHQKQTLAENEFDISYTITNRVLETKAPVLIADVEKEVDLIPPSSSIMNLQLKSVLGVPLLTSQRLIGIIYVDTSALSQHFTKRELRLLSTLSGQAAIAVENATLYTDLQRAHQELTELDKMKSKFISLASHELRTPMTVIAGYLYLLNNFPESEVSGKARDIIGILKKSMEKLTSIVNNIANLARLTAPDYQIEMKPVSITHVIQDVRQEVTPFIEQRNQHLTIQLPEEEIWIEADEQSIWQALANLVINAIRFTEDSGSIQITLLDQDQQVEIQVTDTGIGIPATEHHHIFDQFYEIGDVLYHSSGHVEFKSGGLGVGLSIAKIAVEQHHGKIWLESEEGKGSTFYFRLPKTQPPH